MSIVLIAIGVLVALDVGVWSLVYALSDEGDRSWRVIDANLAVMFVNVIAIAILVAAMIGGIIHEMPR